MISPSTVALVTLFARWFYDCWSEINHDDPELRQPDLGPGNLTHNFSMTSDHPPTPAEVKDALDATVGLFRNDDGKSVMLHYAVMDDVAWTALVNARGSSSAPSNLVGEAPQVMIHSRLEHADLVEQRTGSGLDRWAPEDDAGAGARPRLVHGLCQIGLESHRSARTADSFRTAQTERKPTAR